MHQLQDAIFNTSQSGFGRSDIAEASRPAREVKADVKQKIKLSNIPKCRRKPADAAPANPGNNKLKKPAVRVNWQNPNLWRQIVDVGRLYSQRMKPKDIVHELQRRDKAFEHLHPRVVRRWIVYDKNKLPRWSDEVLARAARGNLPGGQGGRPGIYVRLCRQVDDLFLTRYLERISSNV